MHYLLFYDKAPDHAQREGPLMAGHRDHLQAAVARGELLLGGPLADPIDGTNVLLFQSDTAAAAETFAAGDPYVLNGVVVRWRVRRWETVVGREAACPLPEFENTYGNTPAKA
jgi:uncharacterized protein YciI